MGDTKNINKRSDALNTLMNRYRVNNKDFLSKKTLHYLSGENSITQQTSLFTLTQVGTIYSLDKSLFNTGCFDDKLLNFFSKYRTRCCFVFKDITITKKLNLLRIIVSYTTIAERAEIDQFMADNLEAYPNYQRATTNVGNSREVIIDINRVSEVIKCTDKFEYKDLALIFY